MHLQFGNHSQFSCVTISRELFAKPLSTTCSGTENDISTNTSVETLDGLDRA